MTMIILEEKNITITVPQFDPKPNHLMMVSYIVRDSKQNYSVQQSHHI